MKREYFPLRMFPIEVFKLFDKFDRPSFQIKDTKTIVCYTIKDLQMKRALEKLLIADAIEFNPKVKGEILVSNKRKPLYLSLHLRETDIPMWEVRVYQERAKGIILNKFSSLENYSAFPFDVSSVLLLLTEKYLKGKKDFEIHRQNQGLRKAILELEQKYALLEIADLHIYLSRKELTSIEKKQILYTQEYYSQVYDEYADHIDDLKTYNEALSLNQHAKLILELCDQCLEKFVDGFSNDGVHNTIIEHIPGKLLFLKNPAGCGAFFIYLINQ